MADILWDFLVESVIITLVAGTIGIAVGVGLSAAIAWLATANGFAWQFSVPLTAYIVSIIFSLLCGVLFGLYPARKAAQLNPIEAIRAE